MVPQIILLLLLSVGFGINLEKHGQPKVGKHDGWTSFFSVLITLGLLYWGGFFDCFFKL